MCPVGWLSLLLLLLVRTRVIIEHIIASLQLLCGSTRQANKRQEKKKRGEVGNRGEQFSRSTQESFIRGVSAPRSKPFYIPFLTEKVTPLIYLP